LTIDEGVIIGHSPPFRFAWGNAWIRLVDAGLGETGWYIYITKMDSRQKLSRMTSETTAAPEKNHRCVRPKGWQKKR